MEAGCPHDPCTWGYKTKLRPKKPHWASLVTLTHVNKDGNGAVYSSPCSLAPSKSDENLFSSLTLQLNMTIAALLKCIIEEVII